MNVAERPSLTRGSAKRLNRPVIERLQADIQSALSESIPHKGRYAILDFPNHNNIGDSAIYVGEAIACQEYFGRQPDYVCEAFSRMIPRIRRLGPEVTVLLHGGGNFGDLYHRHQNFRIEVLNNIRDRKCVMLPQSIHYQDTGALPETQRAIANHPDFTMMVRDRESFEFAERHFDCKVLLVPDCAFAIGPIANDDPADYDLVALIREDIEAVTSQKEQLLKLPLQSTILDWPEEVRDIRWVDRLPFALRKQLPVSVDLSLPASPESFLRLAQQRVDRGVEILRQGKVVLTDRLHAHILSILLGIPHATLDNSYGKIARFSSVWTTDALFEPIALIEEFGDFSQRAMTDTIATTDIEKHQ